MPMDLGFTPWTTNWMMISMGSTLLWIEERFMSWLMKDFFHSIYADLYWSWSHKFSDILIYDELYYIIICSVSRYSRERHVTNGCAFPHDLENLWTHTRRALDTKHVALGISRSRVGVFPVKIVWLHWWIICWGLNSYPACISLLLFRHQTFVTW